MDRSFLTLSRADRHDTLFLQELLAGLGHHVGPQDGRYGIITMRAVVAFQIDTKLEPDGMVGDLTWEKLTTKPKRARTDKGHYVADDPATPDVNEAYEEPEKAPAKKPAAKKAPAAKPAAKKAPAKK